MRRGSPENERFLPEQLFQLYRNRSNLTQMEVAQLLNLKSYQAVGFWEEGRSLPRAVNLKNLIKIYLYRGVFTQGAETDEARQLWTAVKDLQDTKLNVSTLYPVFDILWFKELLSFYLDASPSVEPVVSSDPLQPVNDVASTNSKPFATNENILRFNPNDNRSTSNLPRPLSELVGRHLELSLLSEYLAKPDLRLLTLSGPGGTGKTRLAVELARTVLPRFQDGIFFVDLSNINDPDLLLFTIAKTIALAETSSRQVLFEQLVGYLDSKQLLLILDNFEQIVEAAPLLTALLVGTTHLKILVTSREILQIEGEQRFEVQPLGLPASETATYSTEEPYPASRLLKQTNSIEDIARIPSVAFFLQCTQKVRPGFKLTAKNRDLVIKLVQRLDGLPLAIELASYHLKTFTLEQMLSRLDKSLEILVGGKRDKNSRQHTLRMTLDWSYNLLSETDKDLFRQLAIFVHGFTMDAVEKIAGQQFIPKEKPIWQVVEVLVNKSLLSEIEVFSLNDNIRNSETPVIRFTMLETIREYALEELQKSGQEAELRKRHSIYYTELAEEAAAKLTRANTSTNLNYLELEQDNLRAALNWCLKAKEWRLALRLVSALWRFLRFWGFLSEGRRYLDMVLAAVPSRSSRQWQSSWWPSYAEAIYAAGILAIRQSDYKVGAKFLQDGLELAEEVGDNRVKAKILCGIGELNRRQANYSQALDFYYASLALYQQADSQSGIATVYHNLCSLWRLQGDYVQARKYGEAAIVIWQAQENMLGLTGTYNNLADISLAEGNYNEARYLSRQSLLIKSMLGDKTGRSRLFMILGYISLEETDYQEAHRLFWNSLELIKLWGDKGSLADCLNGLGLMLLAQNSVDQASTLFYQGLRLAQTSNNAEGIVCSLIGLAGVLNRQSKIEKAIQLCKMAYNILETGGSVLGALYKHEYEQTLLSLQASCSQADFELAWQPNTFYTLDEIMEDTPENGQLTKDLGNIQPDF